MSVVSPSFVLHWAATLTSLLSLSSHWHFTISSESRIVLDGTSVLVWFGFGIALNPYQILDVFASHLLCGIICELMRLSR